MKCSNCRDWILIKRDDNKGINSGYCHGINNEKITIHVEDYGYVAEIETDEDFYCANFSNRMDKL